MILIEVVYYYAILTSEWKSEKADAIVVFHGSPIRNQKGYELANGGFAPLLMVSPADKKKRTLYDQKYTRTGAWEHLPEERADTTFQNALLTGRLIRQHQFKRITLVTDTWHMPRSYFFLKMALVGSGVTILPCNANGKPFTHSIVSWPISQKKRMYNEMVELWGGIAEYVSFKLRGKLPERSMKEHRLVKFLRSALLFEIT